MTKIPYCSILLLLMLLAVSCSKEISQTPAAVKDYKQQVQFLTDQRAAFEQQNDLPAFLSYYTDQAISMPEYQPALTGRAEIELFYRELFARQDVQEFHKEIEEIFPMDNTLVEIGTFRKSYYDPEVGDTLLSQYGKYWTVWEIPADGQLKIKGEAYGFFQQLDHPERLILPWEQMPENRMQADPDQQITLELKAYNSLQEKYVTSRDGPARSAFYAPDARFMPFAEPTVSGAGIRPYLVEYNNRGQITIDSIAVYTYHYEDFGEHLLEYYKFWVNWSNPDVSGKTWGKGIRLWKEQEDGALKIFRAISTHNLLP